MSSQNAEPRGDSRVMKLGCARGLMLNEDDRPSLAIDGYSLYEVPVIPGAEHSPHPSLPRMRPEMNRQVVGKGFTRHAVKRIEFHDGLRAAAPDAWDASEAGDGSVLAWLEGDRELHFAAEGGVIAPEDCGELFQDYAYCAEIRFNGCFDTSHVTNMRWMFSSCRSLTALDLSGFDTSRVTDMEGMFCGCRVRSLDLSGFDTSQVTNMESMFLACRALTALNLSGFDTSRVTNMAAMFSDCERLQSLDLSGFDTSRVKDMHEMFRGCSSLTALNLSGFDTAQVKDMRRMFASCRSLTALDVSGFRIAGDANADGMLTGCDALRPEDIRGYALLPQGAQASLCAPKPASQAAPKPDAGPRQGPIRSRIRSLIRRR